jgi:hypothetical protein
LPSQSEGEIGMKTIFLKVLASGDKAESLRAAIREPQQAIGEHRFEVDVESFSTIPRSPFAYWVSEKLRGLFKTLPAFEQDGKTARIGLQTSDDFRWVRLWWEGSLWDRTDAFLVPYAKGGSFSPYYSDIHLAVRWGDDGRWITEWKADQLKQGLITANNSKCWNESYYLKAGVTWSRRPHLRGSFQYLPSGCIFGTDGPAAFSDDLGALIGCLNSAPYLGLLGLLMARGTSGGQTLKYETGYITAVPIPTMGSKATRLSELVQRAWSLMRALDSRNETSHAFTLPALLQTRRDSLSNSSEAWLQYVRSLHAQLAAIQEEIDDCCFALYGIDGSDRSALTDGLNNKQEISEGDTESEDIDDESETDDTDEPSQEVSDTVTLASELMLWAVGVAFGRFDVRFANGTKALQADPWPTDPILPVSPGMLVGEDNLPVVQFSASYPLNPSSLGILVDDLGHQNDLNSAAMSVFGAVFGNDADSWWNAVGACLDPDDHDPGSWLRTNLFEQHLKRYSKSRRKAPIIWQLTVPSKRYSIWLYAHFLTRDSFLQVLNDFISPKLLHEERQLDGLLKAAGESRSAKEQKEIDLQSAFVDELRALVDEVKRIAPLWKPSLDDGIVITMAPLWRMVHAKSWQKELKANWNALLKGELDWSHLAMHLWPERVVPKCVADRSFAIAHGLEENFWFEGGDGKWKSYEKPKKSVDVLVRERTSSAVKAALKSLLEAPDAADGVRRTRRSKAA